jgi:hypothetical protein
MVLNQAQDVFLFMAWLRRHFMWEHGVKASSSQALELERGIPNIVLHTHGCIAGRCIDLILTLATFSSPIPHFYTDNAHLYVA